MVTDKRQAKDLITTALHGALIAAIESWEFGWTFRFSNGATIATQSIWRVLTATGIAVTSEDHQQKFGLPEPVDAGVRASSDLTGDVVDAALVPITGDLRISFASASKLEFFNTSMGYEGWHLICRNGDRKAFEIIALGGGDLAIVHLP